MRRLYNLQESSEDLAILEPPQTDEDWLMVVVLTCRLVSCSQKREFHPQTVKSPIDDLG